MSAEARRLFGGPGLGLLRRVAMRRSRGVVQGSKPRCCEGSKKAL